VKKNNNYMAITTPHLKFLDIQNYLAPGSSYSSFLKAYNVKENKGHFPYEWFRSLENLKESFPDHGAFYSSLRERNISKEAYEACKRVYEENGMQSMREFLVWYNNKDVVPFLEALDKMWVFYKGLGIDMFKDAISTPGLAEKYEFMHVSTFFTLLDKDLYATFKANVTGGPSIIFHRYHEKGKTFIRGSKMCQSIKGYDANALYLWALAQDMPTGFYIQRTSKNLFKKGYAQKTARLAYEWLSTLEGQIQHQFNGGERRVKGKLVDGFCEATRTVYQFHGCFYHGHPCLNKRENPKTGKLMSDLYEATQERTREIGEAGFECIEMWECDWNHLKMHPDIKARLQAARYPLEEKWQLSEAAIVEAVSNGLLFGVVECDLHVPESLRGKFSEMCPIFKNVEVALKDVGDFMKAYGEKHGIGTRKCLIGSLHATQILLATPLLRWYLSHGLQVTKVHQVIQFRPEACFRRFADEVTTARRKGDADPSKALLGDMFKLLGNCAYGKMATNKERHRRVLLCDKENAEKHVKKPFYRRMNQITEECYEMTLAKERIVMNLPLHIAFFVYQYAKLRMLEFYYDFVDYFLDRSDFQYCEMDTDSAYIALSGETFEELVLPGKRAEYESVKDQWFPRDAFEKRTPGLFKVEREGDAFVGLCSKTYFCMGAKPKYSCKGINRHLNDVDLSLYLGVL